MMELLSHPIPAVVLLLGILVFVHEFGHYLVGRLCGIAVETFSIGFGARIFGFTAGGTDYRISWIPLGGYVKFAGAHPSEEVPEGLKGIPFRDASLPKRSLTIVAGPLANFLLAVAVYTTLGLSGISHPPPVIGEVIEGSAAESAGILYGDKFTRIDDKDIVTWRDLEAVISTSPGKALQVTVDRGGQPRTLTLTPAETKTVDFTGKPVTVGRAGIALGRLPAIVSVLTADSPAAQAGLATGDRIGEVTFGAQKLKVESYPELVLAMAAAIADPATESVALQVATAIVPGATAAADAALPDSEKAKPQDGPVRSLMLPLAAARAIGKAEDKVAMRALGLTDGQLTVGEGTETVKGVLQRGDRLLTWNGAPLRDFYALREQLIANDKAAATVGLQRGFETREIEIQLKGVETQKPEGVATIYMLPILFWAQHDEPPAVIERYDGLISALGYGIRETSEQTASLFDNVKSLFTGDIPLKALGGPMLIAKVAGDSARRGWQTFLTSMALISINLGLINLFPIPVLDGGQLVLMGAEAIKRRPLRETAVENFQKIGFAMIMALVVLATYNDLSRFWKSMLESVVGIFQ